MGLSPEEVKEKVKSCKGPNFVGTKVCSINFILQENNSKADKVKLHDDKSNYTGVYKRGGPSLVDKPNMGLDKVCDRSKADVRGVNLNHTKYRKK
jgi:hypothetical protein